MEDLLKNFNVEKMSDLDGVVGHKGSTVVEFQDRDSLVRALELDGKPFFDMNMRITVLEHRGGFNGPRREGGASDGRDRDFDNWDRRGPLPSMEGGDKPRGGRMPERDFDWNNRRGPLPSGENPHRKNFEGHSKPHEDRDIDWNNRRGPLASKEDKGPQQHNDHEFGNKGHQDDRNYDNWEHRGPLPHLEEKKNDFGKGFRNQPSAERDFDWNNRRGPLPVAEDRKPNYQNDNRRPFRSGDRQKSDDPFDQDWNTSKPTVGVKAVENSKYRNTNHKNTFNDKHSDEETKEFNTEAKAGAASSVPHRKRLNLLPRAEKAAEVVVPRNTALFGSAKPVDTASKYLEIEAREEKAKLERAKKAEEAAASNKSNKEDQLNKSFSALQLDEEGHEVEDHKVKAVNEYNERKKEDLTEAEKIRLQEASPEELESSGWNVVPSKKGGRR